MCGIGAIITLPDRPLSAVHIQSMMALLHHRGPDDEGYLCHGSPAFPVLYGGTDSPSDVWNVEYPQTPSGKIQDSDGRYDVLLGHRRLSIVDLSAAGHQPLCSDDRRYWIVYNGEVYNFREIREELRALGYSFYSESDTEVILKSYIAWGSDCLSRFNGMWGFVIYDSVSGEFFIARDRFGVKPVYYWVSDSGFLAISSEIKGFTGLPGWKAELNESRAYDFLVNGLLDHTDETLFKGVFQLRGGHYFRVSVNNPGEVIPVCWYVPGTGTAYEEESSAPDSFRSVLEDAVRLRMRADVPVGSCLSGGLDSSSIVRLVQGLLKKSGHSTVQKTFSASSVDPQWSEKSYSDMVVEGTAIEPHYVYPDCHTLCSLLDTLLWHQDEPFGSTSIFAQWCVFQAARDQGMKVMLDGQGADEILIGYTDFLYAVGSEYLRRLKLLHLVREVRCSARRFHTPEVRIFAEILYYALPSSLRSLINRIFLAGKYSPPWISPAFLRRIDISRSFSYIPVEPDMARLSRKSLFQTSLPMLLHFEDRNSMAHSIESRVPFTDYRIVETALSLPLRMKWYRCTSKWILRESMKGLLPEKVRTRQDKMGFVTPEEVWMRRDDPETFRKLLESSVESSKGVITDSILEAFDRFTHNRREFNTMFWRIIVFGRWMRLFGIKNTDS